MTKIGRISCDPPDSRLRQLCKEQATFVDSLLCCPDYTVKQLRIASGIAACAILWNNGLTAPKD